MYDSIKDGVSYLKNTYDEKQKIKLEKQLLEYIKANLLGANNLYLVKKSSIIDDFATAFSLTKREAFDTIERLVLKNIAKHSKLSGFDYEVFPDSYLD